MMKFRLDYRIGLGQVLSSDFEGDLLMAKEQVLQVVREGVWFWTAAGVAELVPPHQIERATITEIKVEPEATDERR